MTRRRTKPSKSKGLQASQTPGHYPTLWRVDPDYATKLDPSEFAYLNRFLEEYYLSRSGPIIQSIHQLRESWRAYKANRYDLMSRGRAVDGMAIPEADQAVSSTEDRMIAELDAKRARTSRVRPRPVGRRLKPSED